ncbi:MAG: HD-GYP domain-containing protein [Bacillota bacterium]
MRFIPSYCLREGQILACDLVADKNKMLLRKGATLTDTLIKRICYLGFQGIYIDDDISADIVVADIISNELKYKAKAEIRSLLINVENNMKNRIASHVETLTTVISNIVDEILHNRNMMVNVVDIRAYDDYTYSHCLNVTVLSVVLGTVLGLEKKALNELAMGALMHDIGKVFIDKKVINKAGPLNEDEYEEVKMHSLIGYNYVCTNHKIPQSAQLVVLTHHERFDGSGYPTGLQGSEIPLFGRIVAVTDVYDAMVSDRPYSHALLPSDAVEFIMGGYNTLFDPTVVDAFTRKVAPYPVGTCVILSNGLTGIVVQNYEYSCLRPKVRLIRGNKPVNEFIDLAHDYDALNITIKEIINL